MPDRFASCILRAAAVMVTALCTLGAARGATLEPYADEAAFVRALAHWRSAAERLQGQSRGNLGGMALSAAAPQAMAKSQADAAPAKESITNVQTAGVDEGDIVKAAGDHLLILRRGRLFTVRVGGDALQPVAMSDAYAPGSDPGGTWYDELLVDGSTVVVVGYSYARGGTEIGLFHLGDDGSLGWRATYHLRSFDYYSSRNYASRLIGHKLIFYTPMLLRPWGPPPWQTLPAMRRWRGDAAQPFERILPPTRVYRVDDDFDPAEPLALHAVNVCDLAATPMRCESTAVLGPQGRVFYVSAGSVYVWTASSVRSASDAMSAVFRIPLDGSAPSSLKAAGVPIDQMSFLEDGEGFLNVLIREHGRGEGMWGSEHMAGAMALMRVPLAAFGDGHAAAQRAHYRTLPTVTGVAHNRFVGDWLLWAGAKSHARHRLGTAEAGGAWAVRFASDDDPVDLSPAHAVERIEALGSGALLVGNDGADLHFSSVRLSGANASIVDDFLQPDARQGESRSHGFFYRSTGRDEGLLGLPVAGADAASVLYLRQSELSLSRLGRLDSTAPRGRPGRDDACKASCVDWYGNARPIFLGQRVFALLGYELVEGRLRSGWQGERIEERRRTSFAPGVASGQGRYSPFQ